MDDDHHYDHYDEYDDVSHKIDNKLKRFEQKLTCQLDKNMSEHIKTIEQCLDGRTVAILYKWMSNDILQSIHGCIKTGKEGNVYYGRIGNNCVEQMKNGNIVGLPCSNIESNECSVGTIGALKIYKTSCMTFKDRTRYMDGERRFTSFCKSNSRKLAKVWGEKEIRNLNRLFNRGIKCPRPIGIKLHVILMEFIGHVKDDDQVDAAPRLVDVKGDIGFWSEMYIELLLIIYRIYHDAHLIHADYSEYNILYHENILWVIDVAQAVEQAHPRALDFLKSDISNIERFCKGKGVQVFSKSFILDWILNKVEVTEVDADRLKTCYQVLERTQMNVSHNILQHLCSKPKEQTEAQFNSHVPNSLWEFDGTNKVESEFMEDLVKPKFVEVVEVANDDTAEDDEYDPYDKPSRGHRHEDRDDKKARKRAVKEQQKQNRVEKKSNKK